MKPNTLKTRIFLDSGDPVETKQALDLLGFLDGQTTNPSLVAKNPEVIARMRQGEKFSKDEILSFYKHIVQEISSLIPSGSVSVEVSADKDMAKQARDMASWIPNSHIKLPITKEGLQAAAALLEEGIRVNMTLCFSQEQAAAVYAATKEARKGDVFISPFIGRLDDRGENGMDLIKNIIRMYEKGDGHVAVLTASLRSHDHFMEALDSASDIITAPFKILQEWAERGFPVPDSQGYNYVVENLQPIPYREFDMEAPWNSFTIAHPLTDRGIEKFSTDWNQLIAV